MPPVTWVVQVVKTAGMDLTTRQGQVALLAAVVKRIDRLVSDERALQVAATVVDEAAPVPPGQDPVEAVRARWDAVAVGDVVELAVGEDFLRVVAAYVDTSDWLQPDRGELRLGPPVDDGCWRPVLVPGGGTTVAERVAFALGLIRRAQEDDMRARAQGGAPLPRRYEVGAVYGGLVFVGHPYVGFLDDQLWLTPDGSLFWLNQRACSLEAFRAAVVRAAPTVRLAVAVSAVSALAAGALVAGPALAAAGPVLREAGYAAQAWVLANPITARQLFFVGVELTLAVAFNQDLPPISPADQLEFHVAGVLSDGTQAAIRYVTEVAGTPVAVSAGRVGKGVELRLLVHEIQVLIGRAAARVVRQRPTIVQLTRVPAALGGAVGAGTPPAALGAMAARPHLSARALTWMRAAGFSEAAVRRVLRVS